MAGTRISYSNNSSASKKLSSKSANQEGSWGPDVDADVDGQEINETHMPTTLPFTPRRPWDPREIKVSDEDMSDVTMLKKLTKSISSEKAKEILGDEMYSILLRRDKWDNESIGLTKEHVQQLMSRKFLEDPLALSAHSESMMEQLDADDQPHNIWAVAKEAVNVDAPNHHCFAAGSILSPTRQDGSKAEDRLLLLQLPHTFPFVKDSMEVDQHEFQDDIDSDGLSKPSVKNPLRDQPSGRMGKIRIHQSGKVTLRLGEVNYKIAEAAQSNFLQQVVATKDSSDDMFHLGDIFAKLNVIPDLESLLGNDV
uniref:DNA-directed RNA polymerase III subunit RPC4 n=1 Tax=Guillardia theta TaxID=55529 RepID=A0A7S4PM54_GUITH